MVRAEAPGSQSPRRPARSHAAGCCRESAPGAIRPRVAESDPGRRPGTANALPSPEPSGREEGSRHRPCHRHGHAVLSLHSETGLGPGAILSPRRDHSWPSARIQVSSAAEVLTDCGRVVPQGGQALHPRVRPRLAGPGKGRGPRPQHATEAADMTFPTHTQARAIHDHTWFLHF